MWMRVESAYIFHHKYPIPEYSMINGNHEGNSSREAPKSENNAVKLIFLLFIVHNDKGFPRLWLIKCYHWCNIILFRMIAYGWEFIQSGFPRSKSMTVRNWVMTYLYHHPCEVFFFIILALDWRGLFRCNKMLWRISVGPSFVFRQDSISNS